MTIGHLQRKAFWFSMKIWEKWNKSLMNPYWVKKIKINCIYWKLRYMAAILWPQLHHNHTDCMIQFILIVLFCHVRWFSNRGQSRLEIAFCNYHHLKFAAISSVCALFIFVKTKTGQKKEVENRIILESVRMWVRIIFLMHTIWRRICLQAKSHTIVLFVYV